MKTGAPRVAAIVLDYNGRDVTLQALASLTAQDYPACDVVVVDNGSSDGSEAAIRAAYPGVAVVRSEQNLGPSGGGNLGFRWALEHGYDYALMLNNDIEVAPDFVRRLVEAAEADPKIGLVGPKAYYYWQRDTIWSAGGRLRFAADPVDWEEFYFAIDPLDFRRGDGWGIFVDEAAGVRREYELLLEKLRAPGRNGNAETSP